MKANEIITVLNHFKDSSYQRILINGNWGIGKTKYVLDFKRDYTDVCYVSLFGKKDINSIIQEIYFRILETAENGKFKKHFRTFREVLSKFNFSYYGVSVSVPYIENLHKALNKELENKDTYLIIFDDLERKHEDLGIKEVLGLLDSLSKIESIKTVLIAATEQLEGESKEIFKNYREKAIDRTYTIEEYADEAPEKILGEEAWKVIRKHAGDFKFTNLRTFEKTSLFMKEVIEVLGEEAFSDKFTKDDLYRMCYATVFFMMEHHSEMRLIDTSDENKLINAYYTSDEGGVIEYLCNYILKNSLDNVMSKSVFHHIFNWYETGSFSKEKIMNLVASINSFETKPKNFYSSEEEILGVIDYSKTYFRNLDGTEQLDDIITKLSTALAWCEALSVDFGIGDEEIVNLIRENIINSIDITKGSYQNEIDLWHYHVESAEAKKVVKLMNDAIKVEYYNQLLKQINDCFNQHSYNEYSYLRQLNDSIISIKDKPIRDSIQKSLSDHQYFFPIPSGSIKEEQWNWCHLINTLIVEIARQWDMESFYNDFKGYIYNLEITKNDKMLQHRLKSLFGEERL
ncbi:KAP family NTPase [Bacillus sp. FJAT-29953]|nr:KAP family NTPase [Bacillus sp. FJAT-29953]